MFTCGCGPVFLRRKCDTLCNSGFVDDILFYIMTYIKLHGVSGHRRATRHPSPEQHRLTCNWRQTICAARRGGGVITGRGRSLPRPTAELISSTAANICCRPNFRISSITKSVCSPLANTETKWASPVWMGLVWHNEFSRFFDHHR